MIYIPGSNFSLIYPLRYFTVSCARIMSAETADMEIQIFPGSLDPHNCVTYIETALSCD